MSWSASARWRFGWCYTNGPQEIGVLVGAIRPQETERSHSRNRFFLQFSKQQPWRSAAEAAGHWRSARNSRISFGVGPGCGQGAMPPKAPGAVVEGVGWATEIVASAKERQRPP